MVRSETCDKYILSLLPWGLISGQGSEDCTECHKPQYVGKRIVLTNRSDQNLAMAWALTIEKDPVAILLTHNALFARMIKPFSEY